MLLELFEPAFDFTVSTEQRPILMVFVSDYCGYCQELKPMVAALGAPYTSKVATWMVNVERSPRLGRLYAPDGVPVLTGWAGGKPVWREVGLPAPDTIKGMYEKLANTSVHRPFPTWGMGV